MPRLRIERGWSAVCESVVCCGKTSIVGPFFPLLPLLKVLSVVWKLIHNTWIFLLFFFCFSSSVFSPSISSSSFSSSSSSALGLFLFVYVLLLLFSLLLLLLLFYRILLRCHWFPLPSSSCLFILLYLFNWFRPNLPYCYSVDMFYSRSSAMLSEYTLNFFQNVIYHVPLPPPPPLSLSLSL